MIDIQESLGPWAQTIGVGFSIFGSLLSSTGESIKHVGEWLVEWGE